MSQFTSTPAIKLKVGDRVYVGGYFRSVRAKQALEDGDVSLTFGGSFTVHVPAEATYTRVDGVLDLPMPPGWDAEGKWVASRN